jgi:hypothetical protein
MFGSKLFRPLHGKWEHFGTLKTNQVWLSATNPNAGLLPRGTFLDMHATIADEAALASGNAMGCLVEDLDADGTTSVQSYYNRSLGVGTPLETPIKKGQAVSLRRFYGGAGAEFEGLGTAVPGNLVCTSGTGAISAGTARKTRLSVLNGCLRVAQTGDIVIALVEKADLTPNIPGNVRIEVRFTGNVDTMP